MRKINITIDGLCSVQKYKIAEVLAKALKEMSFGKVTIAGVDYKGDYLRGRLGSDQAEIIVVPREFSIKGNPADRMALCKEIKGDK